MSTSSPCINICRMDEVTGLCEGCFRSIDEIAGWRGYDDEARQWILEAIAQRRAELAARNGAACASHGVAQ